MAARWKCLTLGLMFAALCRLCQTRPKLSEGLMFGLMEHAICRGTPNLPQTSSWKEGVLIAYSALSGCVEVLDVQGATAPFPVAVHTAAGADQVDAASSLSTLQRRRTSTVWRSNVRAERCSPASDFSLRIVDSTKLRLL